MSPSTELYHAARHGAAVLQQTSWYNGILRLTGPDRVSWLQGMVTNDVEKLLPGQGTYAAHLNAQGKFLGQMAILIDSDVVWLATEASNVAKLQHSLEPMIVMEDVLSEDCTALFFTIEIVGPAAATMLENWLAEPLNLVATYTHRQTPKCPRIMRTELGFMLWVDPADAQAVMAALIAAGAQPIDAATWNVLRIESGLPLYGVDIEESATLPELGEKGISYDKGCYIGQEVVARIKYIGHVNRRFMGFVCEGDVLPERRSVVRSGGKDVGYVTSSVRSPGVGQGIALGFVSRANAVAGTPVELISGETKIPARVVELPFIPLSGSAG